MDVATPLPEELQPVALGSAGLSGWKIATPHCRALVSAQGAQVLEFQAVGKKPLLWLSEAAAYQPGRAIRGGIPLCFPWFGPAPDAAGPAHGFARLLDWQLAEADARPEALHLLFRLGASAATQALWPHEFEATLAMTLGRVLQLQLAVANTGSDAFSFTFAFHSYFPVSDIRRAQVDGLDGTPWLDQLDPQRTQHIQQGPVTFAGETDRIHLHTAGEYCLVDAAGQAIRVSAPSCRSAVIWNPGPEKAARLADMAPDAWQRMACVECGNVDSDTVTLPAGASKLFTLLLENER
jgi:glucose-6-phosphate 1-epimerase